MKHVLASWANLYSLIYKKKKKNTLFDQLRSLLVYYLI